MGRGDEGPREAVSIRLEAQAHLDRAHDHLARAAILVDADLEAADEAQTGRDAEAGIDAVEPQPPQRIEATLVAAAPEGAAREVADHGAAAPLEHRRLDRRRRSAEGADPQKNQA